MLVLPGWWFSRQSSRHLGCDISVVVSIGARISFCCQYGGSSRWFRGCKPWAEMSILHSNGEVHVDLRHILWEHRSAWAELDRKQLHIVNSVQLFLVRFGA